MSDYPNNPHERTNPPYNVCVCADVCPDLPEVSCDLAYGHKGPHQIVISWEHKL